MKKKLLPIFWVLMVILLILLSAFLQSESNDFFGIADNQDQSVRFDSSVEIVHMPFLEGEKVKKGDIIIEVHRNDLDASNNLIDTQLKELNISQQTTHDILDQLNKNNRNISQNYNDGSHKVSAKIAALMQKKEELQRQMSALKIVAKFDGYIGSTMYQEGETVPPYKPILTLHGAHPEYIKGYIHEKVINNVQVGDNVKVKSIGVVRGSRVTKGIVISLGNRIVEYPDRLKKNSDIQAWGREVMVKLEPDHDLLFGEKLKIMPVKYGSLYERMSNKANKIPALNSVIASNVNNIVPENGAEFSQAITSFNSNIDAQMIEASGVLWDNNYSDFLLISDEGGVAAITSMDADGVISKAITLENCPDIDDLESISSDNENIYVLASLSHNAKKELKQSRSWFLRLKRTENVLRCTGSINMHHIIDKIAKSDSKTPITKFLSKAISLEEGVDVESHALLNNGLLIGFKAPFNDEGKSVIIKIDDLAGLFDGRQSSSRIWLNLGLPNMDGYKDGRLSDMLLRDDDILLLAVYKNHDKMISYLFSYNKKSGIISTLDNFSGLRAEGVSANGNNDELMIVFDGGGKSPSRYNVIKLTQGK